MTGPTPGHMPNHRARPGDPAGWYRSPSGRVLRWWTGPRWVGQRMVHAGQYGSDVAGLHQRPDPPPADRRDPPDEVTQPLDMGGDVLPPTVALPAAP